MQKLSRSLIILGSAVLIYIAGLFGTSVLNNFHLKYLRGLGSNVVLIHSAVATAGATGFMVRGKSGKIYTMTNNHVCHLETMGMILGTYQGDDYVLKVLKRYPGNDLCVLSAPNTATKGLKVAKEYTLGQTVYSIGHPQLEPLSISIGELSDTIVVRIVSEMNGKPEDCSGPTYEYRTDIDELGKMMGVSSVCVRSMTANTSSLIILPGNSGSPVLDIWGSVVGVVFAANEAGTRSYVIPLSYLQDFLDTL
jgi:S1-C subfamily serine protease